MRQTAREFAIAAHTGQMYGKQPYWYHLQSVVDVAHKFELSLNVIQACWLHDTLEDTQTTFGDLRNGFGVTVADAVYAVTDELGRNRKERKEKTYLKIAANPNAILVKLCDRIANIEASEKNNPALLKMYLDESPEFVRHLYGYGLESQPIWRYYFDLIERLKII